MHSYHNDFQVTILMSMCFVEPPASMHHSRCGQNIRNNEMLMLMMLTRRVECDDYNKIMKLRLYCYYYATCASFLCTRTTGTILGLSKTKFYTLST